MRGANRKAQGFRFKQGAAETTSGDVSALKLEGFYCESGLMGWE